MSYFLKSSVLALSLAHGVAHAINPVQGVYAGIFLGGSKAQSLSLKLAEPLTLATTTAQLDYSFFGDIGFQVGYRVNQFRVEGEVLVNNSPYNLLTLDGVKYKKRQKSATKPNTSGISFTGSTTTAGLMVNGLYDAYSVFEQTNFVPYLGVGVGYAGVQNSITLYNNGVLIPHADYSTRSGTPAAQGIIGAHYFMDDFTTFGLDFRYLSTKSIPVHLGVANSSLSTRVQIASINFSFNGAFDAG